MATTLISFPARQWVRTPLMVRAIASGLAVLFIGVLPWSALVTANLRFGSSIPWAVLVMTTYLVGFYLYLSGWGWPRSTSAVRCLNLRARGLSARVWFWSLAAGGCAATGLFGLFFIGLRMGQVPAARFDEYVEMGRYPAWTVVLTLVMSAAVAGAVEEAAFRGYMQAPLERRYGPVAAIGIVGLIFFLVHFAPLPALPGFALGAMTWGFLAYLTGSIWPGVVLHTLVDTTSFLWAWCHAEQGKALASSPVWETGVDTRFCLLAGGALVMGISAVVAYLKLARVTRPMIGVGRDRSTTKDCV